jgi:hypothetical protein
VRCAKKRFNSVSASATSVNAARGYERRYIVDGCAARGSRPNGSRIRAELTSGATAAGKSARTAADRRCDRIRGNRSLTDDRRYFFFPEAKPGCQPAAFWLGAAAMTLIFSFLGFLVSRVPRRSPLLVISVFSCSSRQFNSSCNWT